MYGRPLRGKVQSYDLASHGTGAFMYAACSCGLSRPLALMEFADRRLINGSRLAAPKALRALSIPGPPDCAITSLSPSQLVKLALAVRG